MVEGDVSHDQITRFLSKQEYTSKDLWLQVKLTDKMVEDENVVLIVDYSMQEKVWTDESQLMFWHYDHCTSPNIKGINLLKYTVPL